MEVFSSLSGSSSSSSSSSNMVDDSGGAGSGGEFTIPSWKDLQQTYEKRWLVKKAKFHEELTNNFRALVERFATGKQEIFTLCVPERMEHAYKEAFLELFESGYAPHIGDVERLAGKRVRRLFITLPTSSLD